MSDPTWVGEVFGYADKAFIPVGMPAMLESEDLIDRLLDVYLSMMSGGWIGVPGSIHDEFGLSPRNGIFELYLRGLWLPCCDRLALMGQIDIANDGLPDYAAVPIFQQGRVTRFVSVKRIQRPRRWAAPGMARAFYHLTSMQPAALSRMERGDRLLMSQGDVCRVVNHAFAVVGDNLVPCTQNGQTFNVTWNATVAYYASAVLGVVSDFCHLWTVQTEESVIGKGCSNTPLRLGVMPEHMKSLFYARSLPVTAAGRKRPILHWVRAHQRRMAAGIDIDISKHLRGITEFEMGDFPFRITSPVKRPAEVIRLRA